ncbi:hypothetical protein [Sphingomonas sp. TDK1]|uniref:hypothetical protein n=1 Tax=Sphingomonas sp. TDK1 TaxID=453247 RepID=UPI0007D97DD6|nr:hypothetical protein [Sphingomonas sp. TDK1]OAN58882.1 hypothetical protein A7X12_04380 [Sphingomonas sp. TDK1]
MLGLAVAVLVFLIGAYLLASRLRDQVAKIPTTETTVPALLNLPLGIPEGSVRALLSLFVIVFGFAVVVLQEPLGLRSAEAITGFIGAVIAFYFSTRTEQAVRDTTEKAAAAQATAERAATATEQMRDQLGKAQDQLTQTSQAADHASRTAEEAKNSVASALNQSSGPVPSATDAAAQTAAAQSRQRLLDVQADLTNLKSVLEAVGSVASGPQMVSRAVDLLDTVKQGLAVIAPLLAGETDAGTLAKTADDMADLVHKVLPDAPVVSTIFDLLSQAAAALDSNGAPAGAAGSGIGQTAIAAAIMKIAPLVGLSGPLGIVGGLLASGASLVGDQLRFDRLKAALTERPFDLELLRADRLSDTAILQVLDFAPLMNNAVTIDGVRDMPAATALFRLLGSSSNDAPQPASAIAAAWLEAPPEDLTQAIQAFKDVPALTEAIEEYRTGIIALNAIAALPPRLAVMSPDAGAPDSDLPTSEFVSAIKLLRQIPGAADAVDQTVSLIETLRGVTGSGGLAALLKKGFEAAQGLLPEGIRAVAENKMAEDAADQQAEGQLTEELA